MMEKVTRDPFMSCSIVEDIEARIVSYPCYSRSLRLDIP